ncbi:MAG: hypothetical protein Q9M34_05990, partial [Sulfurimonas sp.]|nr:hypothetical protein [Sulfurimonas sp.]
MNNFKLITLSLAATVALSMTGCGGSDTTTAPTTTPTVAPATSVEVDCSNVTYEIPSSLTLSGDISTNTHLTADKIWSLDGLVKIKGGTCLKIDPGTTIASPKGKNFMVVLKNAKIIAEGTAAAPIIFTTDTNVTGPGEWGGLTILGNAPTNQTNPYYEVDEADPDFAFGGTDANSNSGVLKYVHVLNSGYEVNTGLEINGLSLCGVGAGTTISDIIVKNSSDDGIEVWGGTVNMNNLYIEDALDDSLDMDFGYTGNVTNVTVLQNAIAFSGFEISSGGNSPMTSPTIRNFTITKTNTLSVDGGIYIKDDTTAPTFIDGNVTVTDNDSGIFVKQVMTDAQKSTMKFGDVTL